MENDSQQTQQMVEAVEKFTSTMALEARRLNVILKDWKDDDDDCPLCGATVKTQIRPRHVQWHLRNLT